MRLFTINEQYEVELNKPWIMLIPEFRALWLRDKGKAGTGDYDGRRKFKTKRELAYIYFCLDFTSPLREWPEEERKPEALKYTDLDAEEVKKDEVLQAAYDKYHELLKLSSRSLKSLRSIEKGLDQLDKYFENIDFNETDKQGKVKNPPDLFIANITKMKTMRLAVKDLEKAVEEELKADTGIRGKATLGDNEGKKKEKWKETGPPKDDIDSKEPELEEY